MTGLLVAALSSSGLLLLINKEHHANKSLYYSDANHQLVPVVPLRLTRNEKQREMADIN